MGNDELRRKTSFNGIADSYDAHRPGYQVELAEDVTRISGIPSSGKIVEIGCGARAGGLVRGGKTAGAFW